MNINDASKAQYSVGLQSTELWENAALISALIIMDK